MRPLKFRAWNKKYKFMYDNVASYPGADCNFYFYLDKHPELKGLPVGETDFADFEVMQYTDIKDKNGKEIFEGDILSGAADWLPRKGVYRHKTGAWLFNDGIQVFEETEIIGNIYQNPELITV